MESDPGSKTQQPLSGASCPPDLLVSCAAPVPSDLRPPNLRAERHHRNPQGLGQWGPVEGGMAGGVPFPAVQEALWVEELASNIAACPSARTLWDPLSARPGPGDLGGTSGQGQSSPEQPSARRSWVSPVRRPGVAWSRVTLGPSEGPGGVW